jgi:hypothetical protein
MGFTGKSEAASYNWRPTDSAKRISEQLQPGVNAGSRFVAGISRHGGN